MKRKFQKIISLVLCLVILSSFLPVFAAEESSEIDFSAYVSDKHPRLYVDSFSGLKEKYLSDPLTAEWYNDLLNEATVISDGGVMCNADGEKLYDIEVLSNGGQKKRTISSQDILARFYCLALAAACEDSKALADRLWLEIEDAINLPNWNTPHWLEPAEMMHSISIAYDWCYKFWTDEQKQLMETKVYELGISNAVREYNGNPRWYQWHHGFEGTEVGGNWTIVCNAGVLLTSLAFYETNPTFYNTKIYNAVRSMKAGLNAYSSNGAYRENLTYWNYATRNLIMATDAFENAIGGNFDALPPIEEPFHYDFTKAPGISITPDFPIYANGPAGVFNYGDASGGTLSSSPAFMWLGNRFNNTHYTKYHLDLVEKKGHSGINLALDLLWHQNTQTEKTLPEDKLFEENFVSMRSSWDNENALWIALKGGINGKAHNHYDLGTFALDFGGVRFAKQLGGIDYDNGNRTRAYKGRTEGQNTVVINPDETVGQYTEGESEFEGFYSGEESSYAILDMTKAYDKAVKSSGGEYVTVDTTVTSARRGVRMFSDKTRLVIQDEFKMNAPSEFYWFMHTGASISLYNNNKSAILSRGGKSVYLNLLSNVDAAEFEIMEAKSLPTSPPHTDKLDSHGTKLAVHLTDVEDVTLAVEFVPVANGSTSFKKEITALDSWHPESDVEREGRNAKVFGVGKTGSIATMIVRSPFGEIVGIDQKKIDSTGEYIFDVTLPEEYKNGIYSVFVNGDLYKIFNVTDGYDAGEIPVSYSISYELPNGFNKSVMIAAEYNDNTLVQLTKGNYNHLTMSSTVVFDRPPQQGSTIKFLFLEDLDNLTPLYPANEIVIK